MGRLILSAEFIVKNLHSVDQEEYLMKTCHLITTTASISSSVLIFQGAHNNAGGRPPAVISTDGKKL